MDVPISLFLFVSIGFPSEFCIQTPEPRCTHPDVSRRLSRVTISDTSPVVEPNCIQPFGCLFFIFILAHWIGSVSQGVKAPCGIDHHQFPRPQFAFFWASWPLLFFHPYGFCKSDSYNRKTEVALAHMSDTDIQDRHEVSLGKHSLLGISCLSRIHYLEWTDTRMLRDGFALVPTLCQL